MKHLSCGKARKLILRLQKLCQVADGDGPLHAARAEAVGQVQGRCACYCTAGAPAATCIVLCQALGCWVYALEVMGGAPQGSTSILLKCQTTTQEYQ